MNSKDRLTWPQSVLMVGCGLIGMSITKALHQVLPAETRFDGVEPNVGHVTILEEAGIFNSITSDIPASGHYDLVVLAVPIDAACNKLEQCSRVGHLVMDVCSVKAVICQRARDLGLEGRFVPTHPMAGRASEGPSEASADLFRSQPWIGLNDWPAPGDLIRLLEATGAKWLTVESAEVHDALMARVSHSVHLVSLSTMLAYEDSNRATGTRADRFCGPAFRDITRLAGSPTGFWTSTLFANRNNTIEHLQRVQQELTNFIRILEDGDEVALRGALDSARTARHLWEDETSR